MITKIINGKVIADKIEEKTLYIKDGKILDITDQNFYYDKLIDASGLYISPGFIDIHTHGAGGFDFMDGGIEPIIKAAKMHLMHGTTSIMPTSTTCSIEITANFINDVDKAISCKEFMPHILGVHLEGPYFSLEKSGAQNPAYIKPISKKEYNSLLEMGKGIIKRWSFAPELEGSDEFVKALINNNIIPSIAHTNAVFADVKRVYQLGCKLITHLYSSMSSIIKKDGHRILGVVEAAYYYDDIIVEVIADGVHLPKELLYLIYKIKGADNICLVTDSMRGAGMGDGPSFIGRKDEGLPCIIENGVAILPDKSSFAGSVATADTLIKTFVNQVGIDLATSIKMITQNPAKVLGLKNKGKLAKNYDADIVLFDEDINIKKVIINGLEC